MKVRTFNGPSQTYEFTSQFFMDEAFTDTVYQHSASSTRGIRDTRDSNDGIYNGASSLAGTTSNSGSELMLNLRNKGAWVEADVRRRSWRCRRHAHRRQNSTFASSRVHKEVVPVR